MYKYIIYICYGYMLWIYIHILVKTTNVNHSHLLVPSQLG
jgi:hypothetical protein